MKTSTKVLLGIGTTAILGTALAVVISEKVIDKLTLSKNRSTVKHFVTEKLDGSPKLLDIVDELTDSEIESVVGILSKVNEGKKRISVTGQTVKEATEDAKKKLSQFLATFA